MEFKDRLRELRINAGLTQKELGQKLNLAESTISHYESGIRTPDPKSILRLADLFKCSMDYICGRSDSRDQITLAAHDTKAPREISPEVREYIIKLAESFIEEEERKKKER